MPEPTNDPLRRALHDAVSDVEPSPALDQIRSRTKVTPMSSRRPWIFAAVAAAAVTAATVTGVTLASNGTDSPGGGTAAQGNGSSQSPDATGSPAPEDSSSPAHSPSPSPAQSPSVSVNPGGNDIPAPSAGQQAAVPVYYLGATTGGPRLFREFHRAVVDDQPASIAAAALDEAVTGTPLDPDYSSPWPAGTHLGRVGTVEGSNGGRVVEVDLVPADGTDLAQRPAGMTAVEAQMAVQQLVYTAQAALQERTPVSFSVDGTAATSLLGVNLSEPVTEADAMAVQAPVWIIDPQDGATVGRTFTVTGRGAFFEANVVWELRQGTRVVQHGFTMAQECCTLAPYSFKVTAAPGQYVLRVYDANQSGEGGTGESQDTKRITVR